MRLRHWLILLMIHGCLTLPELGTPALWDMDEGVNAECTREMLESGTWIVPTYNWELRTAKPVLTYWIQRPFFVWFGVSEWSARFPSTLLGLASVLLTYELARRMFHPLTGLLAGVVLTSTIQFCLLSHAATPDASLICCFMLVFTLFWLGHENGGTWWWYPCAVACALAVLSKGPIGVAFPGLIFLAYFAWMRELSRLLTWRMLPALLLFLLVAGPWYGLVTSETRGEWAGKFFGNENLNRFATPQENHSGPIVYYLVVILVMSAPWSSVIGLTLANAWRERDQRAVRFLLVWIAAFLGVFSVAATKLPNYIAPLYPALGILTARLLVRWWQRETDFPRWVWLIGASAVIVTGLAFGLGLLLASGQVPISWNGMRTFPGLEAWAPVGLAPVLAGITMIYGLLREWRGLVVLSLASAAVVLLGVCAVGPAVVIDQYKSVKTLVREANLCQPERELRIGTLNFSSDNQSLVFYVQRRVEIFHTVPQAEEFLATPRPAYLLLPWDVYHQHFAHRSDLQLVAKKYDFYRNTDIVVVKNAAP